ncbi:MAG: sugar phosphate nucleotidyltransferase [Steroidobacteraceae bacterium]
MERMNTPTSGCPWAIVLAAGNGSRLRILTRDVAGGAVPKQFCSLDGTSTLIERTLARAASVVGIERVTTVVSPLHRCHWEEALRNVSQDNIIIQPKNRGTAIGILLPTLRILARDPDARILILPSDHYVADESVLNIAMCRALHDIRDHQEGVALLGIEADEADPELGYIVPGAGDHPRLLRVRRFIEKPIAADARRLVARGALWNSFILACRADSLVDLCFRRCPDVVHLLRAVESHDYASLSQAYAELPEIDFSRHIATGQERQLVVTAVPRCGWNDLGTPHRLARTLAHDSMHGAKHPASTQAMRWINLADRLAELHPHLLQHPSHLQVDDSRAMDH